MALNLEKKQAIVAKLVSVAKSSVSVISADYRGLTVSEMTELRGNARKNGVVVGVYRNTLARRAIEGTSFACLHEVLTGPIVLLFSTEEPSAAARLLRDFIKDHGRLEVRALVLGGELLAPEKLKSVASLPSRQEAQTQLVAVMKAPVVKFVRTLNEPVAQVVRVMGAFRDKRQAV